MTETQIYQGLLSKGFSDRQAEILSVQLKTLSEGLSECLSKWISVGEETDFEANGFSLYELMSKYKLKYPAALLSLDWVIKEPSIAIPMILKGIR